MLAFNSTNMKRKKMWIHIKLRWNKTAIEWLNIVANDGDDYNDVDDDEAS